LHEVARRLGLSAPAANPILTGITHASGAVRPGDLYAALPGANRHGAEFIPEAVANGAVAVLTDPAGAAQANLDVPLLVVDDARAVVGAAAACVYGDPTANLPVIGITGTAGKTSTSYLVESGLRAAGHVTGLIGTVETRLGDLVITSERTTPEATDLQALFAVARENGVTAAVMEVSSHALAMGRVGGMTFAVVGYTNFGQDHLDFHPSMGDYFAAKALLFDGRSPVEVLNHDDGALIPLRKPRTLTYSAAGDPAATWSATAIVDHGFRQTFTATGPGGPVEAGVLLPGRHNVANALLAIAALTAIGVPPQLAADGVARCLGVPGRVERVGQYPIFGVVDYAHKPDAIVAVLRALREMVSAAGTGRVIAVIGAGGDRDRGKRPVMGEAAARGSDIVVVTDDNPRTEDPGAIRAEVRAGAEAAASAKVLETADRRAAIAHAVQLAEAGDVVVLLGKGHETGQEINGVRHAFDDRVELARALAARFESGATR
jgi:UDP-N-acetylmuramoyl-L-alanyl-D-glutamate--2,6-diaminopimelate ligase